MTKVAIIDKMPSKTDYSKHFPFEFEVFHLSSQPVAKLLKKDVDLDIDVDLYDYVILVGAEAAKHFAKVTSVTSYAGLLIDDKFLCITNPSVLVFKPEGKPDFQRALSKIIDIVTNNKKSAVASGDFAGINNAEEALAFLDEIIAAKPKYVATDTETTALYVRDGYVLGISLSYKKKHGRYILTDILDERHLVKLQYIFDNFTIVFHNMKFDYKMIFYHLGLNFNRANVHDTMVAHYVLDETDSHGLKQLALKYTDYGDYDAELDEFKVKYCQAHGIKQEDFTYDFIPYDIISRYASIDTAVTLELAEKFLPIIENNPKLTWVYKNLLIRGTLFLMDMEEVGIPISSIRMKAAGLYLDTKIEAAKQKLYSFEVVRRFEDQEGCVFNPASVLQLRKILFDYLGLESSGKRTNTGALSTDKEVLEELANVHELPATLLEIRQLSKIRSSYVSKILPEMDRDGKIRTNFNLVFTTSGRLSSSGKFNAQQIPRDDPIIKGCIQAPIGYKIVSQDLRTAEVYYAAVLSGDKNLQAVFAQGGDLHATIAKMVFNLPCDASEVKKLYPLLRQAAKAITFGILYGSGPAKVAESVTKATGEPYSLEEARDNIKDYFTKFKRLKAWLEERKKFIETNGYTYSFFGRKRRLTNVFSADKGIAAHEVRSGINAEIQSLASDVNLLGAMDTWDEIKNRKLDARIFMLVHDSIVAIVKDEDVEQYCEVLKHCTQKARGCEIPGFPVGVDQDVGQDYSFGDFDNYYELAEVVTELSTEGSEMILRKK